MFNISKEFAPPFKLIAPFFIAGVIFYLLSMIAILFYTPEFNHLELNVAGWVHLFLVGYVMMIIFGAMAQLVPVVLETGHFSIEWYYLIFPLLLIGTIGLIIGFWLNPILLSFGGILVLAAMIIFAVDVFLTIKKSTLNTLTLKAVKVSNIFLLLGILSGFLMALTLSGFLDVNIEEVLKAHVFAVVGGYVLITIYGISLVLLPMFGLAHGFLENALEYAFKMMIYAVGFVLIGSFLNIDILTISGYLLSLGSAGMYIYQIYLIYKTRVRKELDIWYKSMLFGYSSFILSIILGFIYILSGATLDRVLYGAIWFLFVFFIFLINGHLYKIIPFLVWFHRFSTLVGKQKVPMLHEMYPKKQADFEFFFSCLGALLIGVSILFNSEEMFKAGGSFMFVSALFLATSVKWMLSYRS
jgi:hypothetical protein